MGHQVSVIAYADGRQRREETVNGVRLLREPVQAVIRSQPIAMGLWNTIREELNKADLLHMHVPNPLAEAVILSLKPSLPIVVTYHCEVVRQRLLKNLYVPIRTRVYKRADVIVVATQNNFNSAEGMCNHSAKIKIIPYGIHPILEVPPAAVDECHENYGNYILFVGRLVEYKGIPYLLEALRRMTDQTMNLVLVGSGPREPELRSLASTLNLEHRVKFLGEVKDPVRFGALYHGSLAFVLPSVDASEAFGIVLLEAMSCGKPLVTTKLGTGVDIVNEDGATGIQVPPRNATALAAALDSLFEDPGRVHRYSEEGLRRFRENYCISAMAEAHNALYGSLLNP